MENPAGPESTEETEARLLTQLATRQQAVDVATWEVIVFYVGTGRPAQARPYLERLLAGTEDSGTRAGLALVLGQLLEQLREYPAALAVYRTGLALEPADPKTWYFLNNNLGYCLNHCGRYAEAEARCRAALQIDPDRHNAHKNLGIPLEGQGRWAEAVPAYRAAAQRCPEDPRSLRHLEDLLARHPELRPLAEPERN